MKFGPVALDDAVGHIVAHAVKIDGLVLKKGHVVTQEHVTRLKSAGARDIVVAALEDGDVSEDDAARRIATACAGSNLRVDKPFTGRCNLFATEAGLLVADRASIDQMNARDERITLATLPAWRVVVPGEMVATIKIIPFAVEESAVVRAIGDLGTAALRVAAFNPLNVGVISTLLPGLKPSVIEKTLRILQQRLQVAHGRIVDELRVAHEAVPLAEAIKGLLPRSDIIVVFGASAITDRRDVIPAAIEAAGGEIEQFGMPVDPGNLLLLGRVGGKVVLGAPGCARSPAENGFDWVMQRLLAGLEVSPADIRSMGVGGLLMEIGTRGQPRAGEGT